jgi:hypothetical protein
VNEQLTDASEESIALAQRLTETQKRLTELAANASSSQADAAAAETAQPTTKLGKLGRKKK